ncbi:hypothetical protein D3C76_1723690 [compost metagenome]
MPIGVGQVIQADGSAGGRGVDKAPFAHIDAGMADLGAAIGGEEHHITGLQRIAADIGSPHDDHFAGRARQRDTGSIAVHVTNQATAIET